jgi:hypothetical protein
MRICRYPDSMILFFKSAGLTTVLLFTSLLSKIIDLPITIELTDEEYKKTLVGQIINVTEIARPAFDIWPYAYLQVTAKATVPAFAGTLVFIEK